MVFDHYFINHLEDCTKEIQLRSPAGANAKNLLIEMIGRLYPPMVSFDYLE